ncbi:MAG TPA: hypothetical protein VKU87_02855 [Thermomicrobiaceae bacterium]|nr:hypothetical protein [Thermomicrobiaceae bacterium]
MAARQANLFATAFHPELTNDDRIHRWFAKGCLDNMATLAETRALTRR